MRGGYDRVEGTIGRSYDEIEGVTMSMSRNFHMLGKITTGEKVEKLDCLSIGEVVDMGVEVASNDEFRRDGGCVGKKRCELVKNGRKRLIVWRWRWWPIDIEQCELSFEKL